MPCEEGFEDPRWTGHADLNRHLCIMGIRQDSGCPLCQEEDDTTVHLIAQCSALMLLRKAILGDFTLPLDTLSDNNNNNNNDNNNTDNF